MRLTAPIRTALAGLCLVSMTACFEMEQALIIKANGKASLAQSLRFTEGFSSLVPKLAEMGMDASSIDAIKDEFDPLDDADKSLLKDNKVKLTRHATTFDAHGLPTIDVSAKARTIAGLDYLSLATGHADKSPTRRVKLERMDDGHVRLTMSPPAPPLPSPGADGDAKTPSPSDMPEADPELVAAMMVEAPSLSMVQRITVPGTVVSAVPDYGVTLDGGTATWSFRAMGLLAGAQALDDAEGSFQVVFKPDGRLHPSLFE